MSEAIGRYAQAVTLRFDVSEDDDLTSAPMDFRGVAGGVLVMPSAWTAASIGFKVAESEDGAPVPLYDSYGNLVQVSSPAADGAYELPAAVYGAHYVWLWSQDGSGTNVAQAADRDVVVMVKS